MLIRGWTSSNFLISVLLVDLFLVFRMPLISCSALVCHVPDPNKAFWRVNYFSSWPLVFHS